MSPFTLTSTCSMISARSDADINSVATRTTAAQQTSRFSMCNSLETNILPRAQRTQELFQTRKHPAFLARILLRFAKDFLLRKARGHDARGRPGRPPRGFLRPRDSGFALRVSTVFALRRVQIQL